MRLLVVVPAVIGVALADQSAASAEGDFFARADTMLSKRFMPDDPGAAVLVAKGEEIVFRRAYGLASLELGVPVKPEMVFGIASVTKLFTAVSAMRLIEDGKLSLDDQVTDYLPQLSKAAGVRIRHLLSHTSGITGPISEEPGYAKTHLPLEISSDELIASYANYELKFRPGEKFEYSNEGVATLARIIELVTNETWEAFLQKEIFEPASMESTYYAGHNRVVPLSVSGYSRHEGGWRRPECVSFTRGFGMGGLFSSVDDLFRFYQAFVSGTLVGAGTLKQMLTPAMLNSGRPGPFGLGFAVFDVKGRKAVGHGGRHSGWSSFFAFVPAESIFVTVLTNRSGANENARETATQLIELMLVENLDATTGQR